jgi:hypothetical protein
LAKLKLFFEEHRDHLSQHWLAALLIGEGAGPHRLAKLRSFEITDESAAFYPNTTYLARVRRGVN